MFGCLNKLSMSTPEIGTLYPKDLNWKEFLMIFSFNTFPIHKENVLVNTLSIANVVKHGLHVEAVIYGCCINVIISPELCSNNEDDPCQPRVSGPRSPTSRYFLHTKEDNLLCLDWKIDNLGRWLTAPAHRRGIYTFARIHSHTIGRIEYGLRMEWKWLNICKRSFAKLQCLYWNDQNEIFTAGLKIKYKSIKWTCSITF